MNPGRYFMPNMVVNPSIVRNGYFASSGIGLFGRLARGLRSFNWTKLLNGANKTLNLMNQTIPLVRQATPMVKNVKSVLHLAKAFKNETSSNSALNKQIVNKSYKNTESKNNNSSSIESDAKMPTFFI